MALLNWIIVGFQLDSIFFRKKTFKKNVKENIAFALCIPLLETNKQCTPLECHDIFTIYGI